MENTTNLLQTVLINSQFIFIVTVLIIFWKKKNPHKFKS